MDSRAQQLLNVMSDLTKLERDFKTKLHQPVQEQLVIQENILSLIKSINANAALLININNKDREQLKHLYEESVKQANELVTLAEQWVAAFNKVTTNAPSLKDTIDGLEKIGAKLSQLKEADKQMVQNGEVEQLFQQASQPYGSVVKAVKDVGAALKEQEGFKQIIPPRIKQAQETVQHTMQNTEIKDVKNDLQNTKYQEANQGQSSAIKKKSKASAALGRLFKHKKTEHQAAKKQGQSADMDIAKVKSTEKRR